ncbi:armadillo-type protein [Piptocephalis cylindrospora]|uniref:Armadillo-type protein n=1 Tax=Piptocephalis cylindrospora TaxID=1907219 RepID=A0A4P9Y176_9FUNG|nr:armadillo-type protein [Piptocephalis cylindrospora]RKP15331.1 armadillo-type protein [Piptocephalis cylindrospora]|eukprot:RKP12586.1 armadillo-type protein [Piptocephalis cylindrospora]
MYYQPNFIQVMVERLSSPDPDVRFMAATDLTGALKDTKDFILPPTAHGIGNIIEPLVLLLGDSNGDVQSLAVRSFGPLASRSNQTQRNAILQALYDVLASPVANGRDNAILALKGILSALTKAISTTSTHTTSLPAPASAFTSMDAKQVVEKLLPLLMTEVDKAGQGHQEEMTPEMLGGILDLTFHLLSPPFTLPSSTLPISSTAIYPILLPLLTHSRQLIRKKTVLVMGATSSLLPSKEFLHLVGVTLENIGQGKEIPTKPEDTRTWVQLSGNMLPRWLLLIKAKASSSGTTEAHHFLEQYTQALEGLVGRMMHQGEPEEDTERWDQLNDLSEACLRAMEGLALSGLYEPPIDLLSTTLSYDPGYLGDEDDDAMGTAGDGDSSMDGDEEDGEEDDWDAEYDAPEEEDDTSWKVRRISLDVIRALGIKKAASVPSLLKLLRCRVVREREETVKVGVLEVISSLLETCTIKGFTGEEGIDLSLPPSSSIPTSITTASHGGEIGGGGIDSTGMDGPWKRRRLTAEDKGIEMDGGEGDEGISSPDSRPLGIPLLLDLSKPLLVLLKVTTRSDDLMRASLLALRSLCLCLSREQGESDEKFAVEGMEGMKKTCSSLPSLFLPLLSSSSSSSSSTSGSMSEKGDTHRRLGYLTTLKAVLDLPSSFLPSSSIPTDLVNAVCHATKDTFDWVSVEAFRILCRVLDRFNEDSAGKGERDVERERMAEVALDGLEGGGGREQERLRWSLRLLGSLSNDLSSSPILRTQVIQGIVQIVEGSKGEDGVALEGMQALDRALSPLDPSSTTGAEETDMRMRAAHAILGRIQRGPRAVRIGGMQVLLHSSSTFLPTLLRGRQANEVDACLVRAMDQGKISAKSTRGGEWMDVEESILIIRMSKRLADLEDPTASGGQDLTENQRRLLTSCRSLEGPGVLSELGELTGRLAAHGKGPSILRILWDDLDSMDESTEVLGASRLGCQGVALCLAHALVHDQGNGGWKFVQEKLLPCIQVRFSFSRFDRKEEVKG